MYSENDNIMYDIQLYFKNKQIMIIDIFYKFMLNICSFKNIYKHLGYVLTCPFNYTFLKKLKHLKFIQVPNYLQFWKIFFRKMN